MKKILVIILGIFLISCTEQVEQKHNILFISIDDQNKKYILEIKSRRHVQNWQVTDKMVISRKQEFQVRKKSD